MKAKSIHTRRATNGRSKARAKAAAPRRGLMVAAIGASAGGLEASSEVLSHLPADTGMAFVFIHHLDPTHRSVVSELLAKKTRMPVQEVRQGMKAEPNHVYVIPPDADISIEEQAFRLKPRAPRLGLHMPVDHFMRSLAETKGSAAVGVILSGTGTDGTLGLREIQAQGGVTMAQDEKTAKYDGMPRSAIASGCVDLILPPQQIARELARLARHPYAAGLGAGEDGKAPPPPPPPPESDGPSLRMIYELIRESAGIDFTHYRQSTIRRRIERRMAVSRIDGLEQYVKFLKSNPGETKALAQDMLINVTSFFRNAKVFEALKTRVFPSIVKHRGKAAIRVWTPGCASGEELYSLGICLLEYLGEKAGSTPIQLFGTDVSEAAIDSARSGWYPENIEGDVSPGRLRRFFTKTEGGYRVSKVVRDLCIFAQHNLLSDPPFSQMDLVCCRNLLIYLEPVLQSHVMEIFHYATRLNGFLVLGASEGLGTATNLFAAEDRNLRIFSRKSGVRHTPMTFAANWEHRGPAEEGAAGELRVPASRASYWEAQTEFDRHLLTHHAPAVAFVNEDFEVVHTRGNLNAYLKLAPGRPSLNMLKMARDGLQLELRNPLNRAKRDDNTVRRAFVKVKEEGGAAGETGERRPGRRDGIRLVNFEVSTLRLGGGSERYFTVLFRDAPMLPRKTAAEPKGVRESSARRRAARLQDELATTKEYLQSVIETQEATNEELQSASEEVLSSNEELQSTNEELETAKEELQSVNEELNTVNDELRERNTEILEANKDLVNLFSSMDIAVLMVGTDMKIRRFTPQAERMLGLVGGDVGRPLANLKLSVEMPQLEEKIAEVIKKGTAIDTELTARDGARHLLRVLPSISPEGPDGVVLTVVAIPGARKRA